MEKEEIKHLEYLLGKLQQVVGNNRFCIIPSYIHDNCYLATFNSDGKKDKEINGLNLEDVIRQLSKPEE